MSLTNVVLPQHFVSATIDGHTGTAYCLGSEENVEYVIQLAPDGHNIERVTQNILLDGNAEIPSSPAFAVYLEDVPLWRVLEKLEQKTAQFSYLKSLQAALHTETRANARVKALGALEENFTPEREKFALAHLLSSRKLDVGHSSALDAIKLCQQNDYTAASQLLEKFIKAQPFIDHVHTVFAATVAQHISANEHRALVVNGLLTTTALVGLPSMIWAAWTHCLLVLVRIQSGSISRPNYSFSPKKSETQLRIKG